MYRCKLICCGGNIKTVDIERLNDIVIRVERVVGVGLAPVQFRTPIALRTDLSHIKTELSEIPMLRMAH